MVCTLPVRIRLSKMDYLPSFPLALRVFIQCTLGSYTVCQILVFSTLSDPLERMYNESVIRHYGAVLDQQRFAYIVGMISAAKVIGSIFSLMYLYPMLDTYGRKKMAVHVPFILGGCLGSGCQILAKLLCSVELFFVGELCIGAAFPLMNYAAIMYLSECAPNRIRGATTLFLSCTGVIAWMLMSFVSKPLWWGNAEEWHYISALTALMAILHFTICLFYPESPKYLLFRERRVEAERAVRIFHGSESKTEDVLAEFGRELHSPLDEGVTLWKVWEDTQYREALLLVFLFDISNQVSPNIIDINFNIVIRKKFGFSVDEVMNLRIISSALFFPLHFVGAFIVERFGRRFVMYTSAFLVLFQVFWLTLGQFLVDFHQVGPVTVLAGWAVQICGNLLSNCGYGNMALLMVAELCVPSIRTTVAQTSALACMVCQMVLLSTYPPLVAAVGGWYYVPMAVYVCIVFLLLSRRLPETRRMSVNRIIDNLDHIVRSRAATAASRRETISERDPLLDYRRDSGDVY